jgi:uncharacterized membrane protein YphA (DoxX/SURF4 family)
MNILLIVGRIAFVAIFVLSGAQKLLDISGTAAMIAPKIVVPAQLAGVAAQLEGLTAMSTPQLLAILAGVVELAGGLLIAANIGTRAAALLLIVFTAATIFWFHDFWNMAGAERVNNMIHALKNLSLIGALLMLFVIGSWRPSSEGERGEQF